MFRAMLEAQVEFAGAESEAAVFEPCHVCVNEVDCCQEGTVAGGSRVGCRMGQGSRAQRQPCFHSFSRPSCHYTPPASSSANNVPASSRRKNRDKLSDASPPAAVACSHSSGMRRPPRSPAAAGTSSESTKHHHARQPIPVALDCLYRRLLGPPMRHPGRFSRLCRMFHPPLSTSLALASPKPLDAPATIASFHHRWPRSR